MKQTLSSLLFIWMLLLAGNAFSQNYPDGYARTYQFIEKELFQKLNDLSNVSLGDVTSMSETEKESHKNKILTKMVFITENTINNSYTNVKINDEICNTSGYKWWSFFKGLVDWELPFKCEFVSAELKGRHEDGIWYYVTYNINYTYHKDPSAKKHYTGTMTSDFVKKSLTVHDYMYITCTEYKTKLDKVADKLPDRVEKWNVNESKPANTENVAKPVAEQNTKPAANESKPAIVEKPNNGNTPNYLCFTAQAPNSSVGIKSYQKTKPDIQYSIDGGKTWKKLKKVTLRNIGDKMFVKGNNPDVFSFGGKYSGGYTSFKMTGRIAASGSIMSLIDGKGETLKFPEKGSCFINLFDDCTSLTSAPELPATELNGGCYYNMFGGCSNLTSAPELPATNLVHQCYSYMFSDCNKLKSIKVYFSDWQYDPLSHYSIFGSNPTDYWLRDVAPNGTFYCPRALPMEFDESHIPEGWTVKYID